MIVIWLLFSFACFLIELGHPGLFYFLSIGFGSLLAFIVSYYAYPLMVQMIGFIGGTIISFWMLKKWVHTSVRLHPTNVQALIGKQAIVINEIHPLSTGQVNINGQIWSARSMEQQVLTVNSIVDVVHVVGCHVIVRNTGNHHD